MNTDQQKKFAAHIFQECTQKNSPYQKVSNNSIAKQFTIMLVGIFVLLIACILLFDGTMVPAMWQLISIIWIVYYFFKLVKNKSWKHIR